MKHFLKVLYLGLCNIIFAIECALSFYLGIKLIIRIHNATGFAAIGMFFGGIALICGGILLLYIIGFISECFMKNRENEEKKEAEEE